MNSTISPLDASIKTLLLDDNLCFFTSTLRWHSPIHAKRAGRDGFVYLDDRAMIEKLRKLDMLPKYPGEYVVFDSRIMQ